MLEPEVNLIPNGPLMPLASDPSQSSSGHEATLAGNFLGAPKTIAFIDSAVDDATALTAGLHADVKVLLDPTKNGIGQITQILGSYRNLTGIEVISHGAAGQVQLGDSYLNIDSLLQYAQDLQQWHTSLAPGADVLFYGCNVAEGDAGKTFIRDLSDLAGADIAASTDVTGSSARGGNWTLEYSTGNIETLNPLSDSFMETYQGTLPSLFTTQTPVNVNVNDGAGSAGDYELGMEFTSAKAGQISAIRYYKAPSETGTHVGNIWSSTGALLASVTFSGETASGWQQQTLSSPLTIQANTTYVVSVNANSYFAATFGGLSNTVTNGDLSAVADGSNGVINATPGLFPAQSPGNSNYFRDIVFNPTSSPNNHVGTVALSGSATQNQTLMANVTDSDGLSGVTISYQWQRFVNNAWSNVGGATSQTLSLDSSFVGQQVRVNALYTDTLGGVENILSPASSAIIAAAGPSNESIFTTQTPVNVNVNDGAGSAGDYELGMEFTSAKAGQISAIRYYKAPSETGTHVGNIWSSTGALLASVTFSGETASGWQQQTLSSPLTIQANTTYVVSVNANSYFAATFGGLSNTVTNGDLSAVADGSNGVINATPGLFPAQSPGNSNYFRDIVFNPTSSPNNHVGTVALSGSATQNQTLMANVTDSDGLSGVTISYQWQRFVNNAWSNVGGATSQTLSLDSSFVGQQVRVNALYTDTLGGVENILSPASSAIIAAAGPSNESIFTTQTPVNVNVNDGAGSAGDYELGMEFTSAKAGQISAIRYYKAPSETGTHVGNIWSSTGALLASVTFSGETASGWQQQTLSSPLTIQANTTYVVSVNANSYFAATFGGLSNTVTNGDLSAVADGSNGVINATPGLFPAQSPGNSNYFRDIVFSPIATTALKDSTTVFVGEAAGSATITAVRTGNTLERVTLEYTANEIGGSGAATAGADFMQPTFQGKANTGQIVFEIGESEKTFTIPIVNDTLAEGNETFAVGLQNPSSGTLGTPRTVLVTIVDDDSPNTISISEAAVSISEGAGTANLMVQRSGNLSAPASVNFSTSNGTALSGSDYAATSGTVNFAVGQVTQTISVPIIDDLVSENDETFSVNLSSPTGAVLGSQVSSAVTILDNDLGLGALSRQTVATGLAEPTALDWTPDGRYMLVAQKSGVVRVLDSGSLRAAPLIDLSSQVNNATDRGLLGIAINPNFPTTPYVYLLYTYDPPQTAANVGLAGPDGGGNRPSRLVRVTVNPTSMVADPNSLVVLAGTNSTWAYTSHPELDSTGNTSVLPSGIVNGTTIVAPANQIDVGTQDNDPNTPGIQNQNIRDYLADDSNSHSIGDLKFGADGSLYLSVGDGTSYNFVDPRSVRVQDINNLSGKVLRIDPITGAGVPGNPFYDAKDPNANRSKVFYSGVRNAFRFTFDPLTALPVVGDVGWNSFEEINTGAPGSNFGWPYLEGPNQTGSYQNLSQAISFYNNGNRNGVNDQAAVFPILSRSHGAPDFANAIQVGDFYNSNTLMFGDIVNGTLYAATLDANRQVTNVQVFDSNIPYVVDIKMGPDGRLYGLDLVTGELLRWNPA